MHDRHTCLLALCKDFLSVCFLWTCPLTQNFEGWNTVLLPKLVKNIAILQLMLIVSCHTNHERFHPTDLNKHSLAGRLPAALYWGAGSRSLTGKGVSRMEATRLVETSLPCAWRLHVLMSPVRSSVQQELPGERSENSPGEEKLWRLWMDLRSQTEQSFLVTYKVACTCLQ